MFDPGGVGEWSLDKLGMISPPQSPRVHPRSRAEGALGDLGGRKENHMKKAALMGQPLAHN